MNLWLTCVENDRNFCSKEPEQSLQIRDLYDMKLAKDVLLTHLDGLVDENSQEELLQIVAHEVKERLAARQTVFDRCVRTCNGKYTLYMQFVPVPLITLLAF